MNLYSYSTLLGSDGDLKLVTSEVVSVEGKVRPSTQWKRAKLVWFPVSINV